MMKSQGYQAEVDERMCEMMGGWEVVSHGEHIISRAACDRWRQDFEPRGKRMTGKEVLVTDDRILKIQEIVLWEKVEMVKERDFEDVSRRGEYELSTSRTRRASRLSRLYTTPGDKI